MNENEKSGLMQGNRRWVWLAVIGFWVMGCVILAVGGGWFLGQRNADHRQNESVAVATEPTSAAR